MAVSKGVWLDTKARKIVKSEPEEGVLVVAPGSEVTPQVEELIAVYEDALVETADEPAAVETATVKTPSRKAKA